MTDKKQTAPLKHPKQGASTQSYAAKRIEQYRLYAVDYGYYPLIHLISEFEKKECYLECSYIKKALHINLEEMKQNGKISKSYKIPTVKEEYLKMVKDKKWPFDEEKENNKIKLIKEKLENVL